METSKSKLEVTKAQKKNSCFKEDDNFHDACKHCIISKLKNSEGRLSIPRNKHSRAVTPRTYKSKNLQNNTEDENQLDSTTKNYSEKFKVFKSTKNDEISKRLDYLLFPNSKIQKKIDYFITPYNNLLSLDKHMDFTEKEALENAQYQDQVPISKKWKLISKALMKEKDELLQILKAKAKAPNKTFREKRTEVKKDNNGTKKSLSRRKCVLSSLPRPDFGNNYKRNNFSDLMMEFLANSHNKILPKTEDINKNKLMHKSSLKRSSYPSSHRHRSDEEQENRRFKVFYASSTKTSLKEHNDCLHNKNLKNIISKIYENGSELPKVVPRFIKPSPGTLNKNVNQRHTLNILEKSPVKGHRRGYFLSKVGEDQNTIPATSRGSYEPNHMVPKNQGRFSGQNSRPKICLRSSLVAVYKP
ncbi:unnamed protein product [Moneuplotes crassus]|uniref:Uncharacterized protein n=1 Tax=Euplotes crassus TaxID=5936 RepID=A0AAD1U3W5_EUPCR|nr:unnamed protein product [Moneuplotes crassus]